MLTLSRLEAGGGDAPLESLDLMDLIAAIADDARFEAEANGRELNFEGQGEAVALVRGELMHRAFENVIRNAVKYTAAGTCVEVSAKIVAGTLELRVGIVAPVCPMPTSRRSSSPSIVAATATLRPASDSGLAIAQRAVQTHGGTIRAANRAAGGLEMVITLPLAQGH